MTKILKDINDIQICVGDEVAVVSTAGYGAPKHTLEQGTVIRLNKSSISYRTKEQAKSFENFKKSSNYKKGNDYFYSTKLYTDQCVLILKGEFKRDGKRNNS